MSAEPVKKQPNGILTGVRSTITVIKTVIKYAGLITVVVAILTFATSEVEKWLNENPEK